MVLLGRRWLFSTQWDPSWMNRKQLLSCFFKPWFGILLLHFLYFLGIAVWKREQAAELVFWALANEELGAMCSYNSCPLQHYSASVQWSQIKPTLLPRCDFAAYLNSGLNCNTIIPNELIVVFPAIFTDFLPMLLVSLHPSVLFPILSLSCLD